MADAETLAGGLHKSEKSRVVLQSSYMQAFDRRQGWAGDLFQGRYKAFLVEKDRYFLALWRYIRANPVSVKRPVSGGG
jgi:hypothetical protein